MEKSRMLGEFLTKNKAVTPEQMIKAIDEQKKKAHDLGLIIILEKYLTHDEISLVFDRMIEKNESPAEAVQSLGLLSDKEIDDLAIDEKSCRIPLGVFLIKNNALSEEEFNHWLHLFETQDFEDEETELVLNLKRIPLFSNINDEDLRRICRLLRYKKYPEGEIIYTEDAESTDLFLIGSGLVRLTYKSGRKRIELGCLKAGEHFGMHGALSGRPRVERATAIMETEVWRLGAVEVRSLIKEFPSMGLAAATHVSEDVYEILHSANLKSQRARLMNMYIVFFDEGIYGDDFASSLAETIFSESSGKTLLIYSKLNKKWQEHSINKIENGTRNTAAEILYKNHIEGKAMYGVFKPNIEETRDLVSLSMWLKDMSCSYDSIVFFVKPGYVEFRRLIMGLCRRSVLIIKKNIPEFSKYLKAPRDKIFISSGEDSTDRLKTHDILMETMKNMPEAVSANFLNEKNITLSARIVSRWLLAKSIGIALGGGGARGLAHIGILSVLESEGIELDAFSGSSFGSVIGGMKSLGMSSSEIRDFALKYFINSRRHPFTDPSIPFLTGSIYGGKLLKKIIKKYAGEKQCPDTAFPFYPVATQMLKGKQVVIRSGKIWEATMASAAFPVFFPLVNINGTYLGDGGLVNNVPASVLRENGFNFIISSNISIDPEKNESIKPKSISLSLTLSLDILVHRSLKDYVEYSDLEIRPDIGSFTALDFKKGIKIIEAGEKAMQEKLPQLRRRLKSTCAI